MSHTRKLPIAEVAIEYFGSVRKTAEAIEIEPCRVSKWRWSKERKGSAGDIPHRLKIKILDVVQSQGGDITAEELLRGFREVPA